MLEFLDMSKEDLKNLPVEEGLKYNKEIFSYLKGKDPEEIKRDYELFMKIQKYTNSVDSKVYLDFITLLQQINYYYNSEKKELFKKKIKNFFKLFIFQSDFGSLKRLKEELEKDSCGFFMLTKNLDFSSRGFNHKEMLVNLEDDNLNIKEVKNSLKWYIN